MSDEPCAGGGAGLIAALRREPVQLGLLLFFALAVHLPDLGVSIGSPDEEGSPDNLGAIEICQESLGHITTSFHKARNHPLFSILAHFSVRYVPLATLVAARLPAFLAGLLVPFVFYFTHRRWVGREAALVVAFLLLLADPLHHYVTAARGYSMLVLGALLMNQLLLAYLQRPHAKLLAAYVVVAVLSAYTHLWALLLFGAHGVFLAAQSVRMILTRPRGAVPRGRLRQSIAGLLAIGFAAVLVLLLYWPMLTEILAMAGARRASRVEALFVLGDGLLQLARFRHWTLAAYVLLVPIVSEGFARRLRGGRPDWVFWFHVTVVVCGPACTLLAPPQNFDSRFLMGILPSAASLVSWSLSGYWPLLLAPSCQRAERTGRARPVLPRAATWIAGFSIGVMVSNANMTVDIPAPAITSHTDTAGVDHGYFYRNLPKVFGSAAAGVLLVVGTSLTVLRLWFGWPKSRLSRGCVLLESCWWSVLLLVSLPPLVLGPNYFAAMYGMPRWVFEVHLPACAVIWLLAWEHRCDDEGLHWLGPGLLMTAIVVVLWQLGGDQLQWDAWSPLRLLAIAPPVAVVVVLARWGGRVGE